MTRPLMWAVSVGARAGVDDVAAVAAGVDAASAAGVALAPAPTPAALLAGRGMGEKRFVIDVNYDNYIREGCE